MKDVQVFIYIVRIFYKYIVMYKVCKRYQSENIFICMLILEYYLVNFIHKKAKGTSRVQWTLLLLFIVLQHQTDSLQIFQCYIEMDGLENIFSNIQCAQIYHLRNTLGIYFYDGGKNQCIVILEKYFHLWIKYNANKIQEKRLCKKCLFLPFYYTLG